MSSPERRADHKAMEAFQETPTAQCGTIIIRDAVAHLLYPVPLLELSGLVPVAAVG